MSLIRESTYEIRQFRPEDRDTYLDLFGDVLDEDPTSEWFDWKYERNPYADDVPVYVAVQDGDLVGSVTLWPLRMRLGGNSALALQLCDPLVHPDHRDQRLYDRMMRRSLDDRTAGDPAFCFGFPDERTRDRNDQFGWETVARLPTYYRIQNPAALSGLDEPIGRLARVAAKGYLTACDRIAPDVPSLSVDRYEQIPAEIFTELYQTQVPDAIHAYRDEQFYHWRYDNPDWEYESFVARRDGDPVAGVVVSTRRKGGVTTTRIVDLAPLLPPSGGDHYASLIDAVVDAHDDADVISAHPDVLPHSTLSRFGFHRDDAFPLSRVGRQTVFGTYSLDPDGAWTVHDYDLTERNDWLLTFSAHDTA